MSEPWVFKDEWLLRATQEIKGADRFFVDSLRGEKKPFLTHALIDAGLLTPEQLGRAVELTFRIKYLQLALENVSKFGLTLIPEKTCRREFGDAEKNIQDLRIAARHIFPGDVFSCSSPPLPVPIGYLLHMS